MANSYWVTWPSTLTGKAARVAALIWGPQPNAPVQLQGFFQAGPFPTLQAAKAYKDAIGTGAIVPPPGTPIIGDIQAPNPGAFFEGLAKNLTSRSFWTRALEVIIGGGLALVAVNHLFGNPIGKTAKTAVKTGALVK